MGPDGLSLQILSASYGQTHQKKKYQGAGGEKTKQNTTTAFFFFLNTLKDQVMSGLGTAETVAVKL